VYQAWKQKYTLQSRKKPVNPEISSAIAALTSDPKIFAEIAALYDRGRREGIEEAGKVAAFLLEREANFDPQVLNTSIEDLDPDIRMYNILTRNGVNTVWELIQMGESGLRGLRNFSESDLVSIKTKLAANYHLSLRP